MILPIDNDDFGWRLISEAEDLVTGSDADERNPMTETVLPALQSRVDRNPLIKNLVGVQYG